MFPSRPRFDSELGQSFFTFIYFCFIFLKGVRFRVKTNVFFFSSFFFSSFLPTIKYYSMIRSCFV